MGHLFNASRAMGQAVIMYGLGQNGSNFLNTAAGELAQTGVSALTVHANSARRIAEAWQARSGEIASFFHGSIQQAQGSAEANPLPYHTASAGWLFGMAIASSENFEKDTLLSKIDEIAATLDEAKKHIIAYADKSGPQANTLRSLGNNIDGHIKKVKGLTTARDPDGQVRESAKITRALSEQVSTMMQ